jgi:RNA polymerase sigma factor for flagellar operon FliA
MSWRGPDGWQPDEPPVNAGVGEPFEAELSEQVGELPLEDEGSLWQRWKGAGDAEARGLLAHRYLLYARALAGRLYGRRRTDEIEFEEYQQFAVVGLMEAIERFEPGKGAEFRTFAFGRIQGAILNGLDRLTERQQQFAMRRRLLSERTASLAPSHSSQEDAERLLTELGDVAVGLALGFILEGLVAGPDLEEQKPVDPYTQVELREARQQLRKMVARIPERERQVLEMHYVHARQFDEIAKGLQLSKSRVSQIHQQAIARLRALVTRAEKCDVAY